MLTTARSSRTRWVLLVVAALAATLVLAAPTVARARPATVASVEPWLQGELDRAGLAAPVLVLVNATSTSAAERAIVAAGGVPFRSFDRVGFSSALLTKSQVEVLRRQPGVTHLQGNRPLQPLGNTGTVTTRVEDAEQLFTAPDGSELDGSGIGIAVVDSGMAGDHPMYQDADGTGTRLLNIKQLCVNVFTCNTPGQADDTYFVDATGLDTDVLALGGHGTHVTGIAGGREVTTTNGVAARGVARNASLYGLGAGAGLFTLNAAASLNWVLEHHEDPCGAFPIEPAVVGGCAPIRVVNNSYGGVCGAGETSNCDSNDYEPDDILLKLSEHLVLEGVVPVWAAGNGADINDTDPPPNDGSVALTNNPGKSPLPGVLMVANYDDGGIAARDNALNASSSRGRRGYPETYPDVAAPGTSILSACRPYLPICTSAYADPNYGEISGTSMAAPHVAGVVALLLQAHPELTPAQVEDVLEDTAHQFGDLSRFEPDVATAEAPVPNQTRNGNHDTSFDAGHGLVDLAAALGALDGVDVPAYDVECAVDAVATDPAGDATEVLGLTSLPADATQPNFDIRKLGALLDEDRGVVRFFIDVAQLDEAPPVGSTGEYFRFDFSYEGFTGELVLQRDLVSTAPDSAGQVVTDFDLLVPGLAESVVVLENLPGAFDADADRIWAEIGLDQLLGRPGVPASVTPFAAGDEITGVTVLAQRQVGLITATTDSALGGCALVLGAPESVELARTEAAAETSVTFTQPTETLTYTVTFPANVGGALSAAGCDTGQPSDHCAVLDFAIDQPSALPLQYLEIVVTPATIGSDVDVYLLRPDGTQVASSANPGLPQNETEVVFSAVDNGTYKLAVSGYQQPPGEEVQVRIRAFARAAYVD